MKDMDSRGIFCKEKDYKTGNNRNKKYKSFMFEKLYFQNKALCSVV